MTQQLNTRELEVSEVRERLKKREEEVRELKVNLNGQISQVDSEYRYQIEEYREQNVNLQNQVDEMSRRVIEEIRLRQQAEEIKSDLVDRYDRQREQMMSTAKELIET